MGWWGWCCCHKSYILVTHLPMTTSAGSGSATLLSADGEVLWTLGIADYVACGACIGPGGDLYIAFESGVGANITYGKARAYYYAGSTVPSEPVAKICRVTVAGSIVWTATLPNQVTNPYTDSGSYANIYRFGGPDPYALPMGHIVADTYDPDYVWFLGKCIAGTSNAGDFIHRIDGSGSVFSMGSALVGTQWFPNNRFRTGENVLPVSVRVDPIGGNVTASMTYEGNITYNRSTGAFVSQAGFGTGGAYEGVLPHKQDQDYSGANVPIYNVAPGVAGLCGEIDGTKAPTDPLRYPVNGATAHADADGPASLFMGEGVDIAYMAQSHSLSRTRADWGFVVKFDGGSEVWRSDLGLGGILPDPIGSTTIALGFGRLLPFTT